MLVAEFTHVSVDEKVNCNRERERARVRTRVGEREREREREREKGSPVTETGYTIYITNTQCTSYFMFGSGSFDYSLLPPYLASALRIIVGLADPQCRNRCSTCICSKQARCVTDAGMKGKKHIHELNTCPTMDPYIQ